MIVADANLLMHFLQHSEIARNVRHADEEWRVPQIWRFEIANAVLNMRRAGKIETPDALKMLLRGQSLFSICEEEVRPDEAWQCAETYGLTAYDASYVVLAERLGCKLVTLDKEILKNVPSLAVNFEKFLKSR